jgi:DNA-binding NtrC family response regulator
MAHNILFVDDEQSLLDAIKRTLKPEPYALFFAPSGPVALSILEKHTMSVIVSDLRMPIMDGNLFMQKVQKLQPGAIRIILSANAEKDSIVNAVKSGEIWRYIVKPWEDDYFLETIRSAVEAFEQRLE